MGFQQQDPNTMGCVIAMIFMVLLVLFYVCIAVFG